jgi:hypothetical protein
MQSLCAGFRTTSHGPVAASAAADYCLPNRESYPLNFYSKRNISSWSAIFSTLYHNHPRSQLLYISTLYQLPYIILYFSHTILSHRACHCLSLRTPNSAVSQEQYVEYKRAYAVYSVPLSLLRDRVVRRVCRCSRRVTPYSTLPL